LHLRIVKGVDEVGIAEDAVVRNRALQTEWYGEPLGDRVRPLLARLGMSQSGLAGVLGLSAPMLSQLMSGQRAKISNPAVLHRLMAAEELVADPAFDTLAPGEIKARLAEIKAESAATTSGMRMTTPERVPSGRPSGHAGAGARDEAPERRDDRPAAGRGAAESARLVQALLREVASAAEIEAAAGLIADRFPDLAEVLRVYGTGRTSEAEAHFVRTILKETLRDHTVMP
jgi:transcriptional regulator with XRE-family HTH domain